MRLVDPRNICLSGAGIIVNICLCLDPCFSAHAQTQETVPGAVQRETSVARRASGTLEVKLTPQPPDDPSEDATLGRMSIDKKFHGDLEATSKGQMLSALTAEKGSAGYVAIERVSGTLHGRSGTFVLQHSGIMTRGEPRLTVTVVPDSGTGRLTGLAGKMAIDIADGKHSYDFEYTLADTP